MVLCRILAGKRNFGVRWVKTSNLLRPQATPWIVKELLRAPWTKNMGPGYQSTGDRSLERPSRWRGACVARAAAVLAGPERRDAVRGVKQPLPHQGGWAGGPDSTGSEASSRSECPPAWATGGREICRAQLYQSSEGGPPRLRGIHGAGVPVDVTKSVQKWQIPRGGTETGGARQRRSSARLGGESEFSKVLRAGFLPPEWTDLLRNLECQGRRGVRGEENCGEPCGQGTELARAERRFSVGSGERSTDRAARRIGSEYEQPNNFLAYVGGVRLGEPVAEQSLGGVASMKRSAWNSADGSDRPASVGGFDIWWVWMSSADGGSDVGG